MSLVVFQEEIRIPGGLTDIESFRAWAHSVEFPERGRIAFLAGEVWVDMSPEELFAHNRLKGKICGVLDALATRNRLGWLFHDRCLVTNTAAELSTEPDGTFVAYASVKEGRVQFVSGEKGTVELEGSPDMVLEVVSPTSVKKDTEVLPRLYWLAGVKEYWLVDARSGAPSFEILRRGPRAFASARPTAGWVKSAVFGQSFRLVARKDEMGYPEFALEVK